MNVTVKLFLTYAAVSMTSALILFFGEVVGLWKASSPAPFVILWLGPTLIAISIGGPVFLYKLWTGPMFY